MVFSWQNNKRAHWSIVQNIINVIKQIEAESTNNNTINLLRYNNDAISNSESSGTYSETNIQINDSTLDVEFGNSENEQMISRFEYDTSMVSYNDDVDEQSENKYFFPCAQQ